MVSNKNGNCYFVTGYSNNEIEDRMELNRLLLQMISEFDKFALLNLSTTFGRNKIFPFGSAQEVLAFYQGLNCSTEL